MCQHSRFKDTNHPDDVCKLQKAIYGLRQSSHAWFHRFWDFLILINFKESLADQLLFIFSDNGITTYFLVYVDDIIIMVSSEKFISTVVSELGKEFALKDLGALSFFLGIHLSTLDNGDILISQQQYLATILDNLGLQNLKPAETPMEVRIHFLTSEVLDDSSQCRYRQTVGSLLYLTVT